MLFHECVGGKHPFGPMSPSCCWCWGYENADERDLADASLAAVDVLVRNYPRRAGPRARLCMRSLQDLSLLGRFRWNCQEFPHQRTKTPFEVVPLVKNELRLHCFPTGHVLGEWWRKNPNAVPSLSSWG